jgi:hypothetical protein
MYTGLSEDMSLGLLAGFKLPTGDHTYNDFDRDTSIGTGSQIFSWAPTRLEIYQSGSETLVLHFATVHLTGTSRPRTSIRSAQRAITLLGRSLTARSAPSTTLAEWGSLLNLLHFFPYSVRSARTTWIRRQTPSTAATIGCYSRREARSAGGVFGGTPTSNFQSSSTSMEIS